MNSSNRAAVDATRAAMKERGYRWTQPRETVICALAAAKQPEAIDTLFGSLDGHRCDLVTVYRILWALENIGLVRRQYQHNGTAVFDLIPPNATCWVSSREGTNWQPLPEADVEGLKTAAKSVVAQLRAAGFRDVVPVIQFYADRA